MLNIEELLSIKSKPNEKDVSLQLYAQFYENHLCNRVFIFELDIQLTNR